MRIALFSPEDKQMTARHNVEFQKGTMPDKITLDVSYIKPQDGGFQKLSDMPENMRTKVDKVVIFDNEGKWAGFYLNKEYCLKAIDELTIRDYKEKIEVMQ